MENQEPVTLYQVMPVDWAKGAEQIAFISVSESYPLSDHPDSLAIPDVSEQPFDSIQYLPLNGNYRTQFLSKTGISERDNVFLFDYSTGKLLTFPVKKLDVVACINAYASDDDPFDQAYYMIGFAIDKSSLAGIKSPYYSDVLVYIGKEHPFVTQPLTLIEWKKADPKQFPSVTTDRAISQELKGFQPKETYFFRSDSLDFLVQDGSNEEGFESRHVVVLNNRTKKTVFERVYTESEGIGLAPLNLLDKEYPARLQWTGQLFRNQSPVIFGFLYHSFDCPNIAFIGDRQVEFSILCDSRH